MRRSVAIVGFAAGAVGLAVFGLLLLGQIKSASDDDEAPIIVKNGSMDLEPGSRWMWEQEVDSAGATSYVYQPDHFHLDVFNGGFWVKVEGSNVSCTSGQRGLHGQTVVVTFDPETTDPQFSLTFDRKFKGWTRRNVVPADGLQVADKLLRHGIVKQGHIARVDVGNANCTFGTAAALDAITICASKKECQ